MRAVAPTASRPTGAKRPKLYLENDRPATRPPTPRGPVTELEAERAKYATRPSRRDDNAIPDIILKRREQYDEQYGRIGSGHPPAPRPALTQDQTDYARSAAQAFWSGADAPTRDAKPPRKAAAAQTPYAAEAAARRAEEARRAQEQEPPREEQPPWQETPENAPPWDDAPEDDMSSYSDDDRNMDDLIAESEPRYADDDAYGEESDELEAFSPQTDTVAWQDRQAGRRAPRKGRSDDYYQHQNPLDKQPELDSETRLDNPNWKPPEPETPEGTLSERALSERAAVQKAAAAPERVMPEPVPEYRKPPFSLLLRDENRMRIDTREADAIGAAKLEETLMSFGVSANVIKVVHGPAITRYELQPAPGVKVSKIVNLTDDIALNMAAVGVRIEAPIPGKAAIGIEIANDEVQTVHLRDVLEGEESRRNASKLAVALGKDIAGKRIIADLARIPHLLIAGATGSGKSVCINTIITSIIYRATPEEVRLILIDPKKVELAVYNGIPHLLVPVVTDPKKASGALNWAVMEMDERYKLFAEIGVRDIKGYNAHRDPETPLMPQIVVIIDELSDLMLVAPGEVEEAICRIAQLARACGIHLVVATQRPSVNVITGIIKANVPSRIAFSVSSQVDSRTILDGAGAEKLLGKGDMLFAPSGG
ncbi:DNA translocase FtsK, partial [Eubacteriales bacterium OttesenSCG-928-A19]|nr:DNA translocase FtsK [Eubacteriales bacterium OttesenSCG-928-A19]